MHKKLLCIQPHRIITKPLRKKKKEKELLSVFFQFSGRRRSFPATQPTSPCRPSTLSEPPTPPLARDCRSSQPSPRSGAVHSAPSTSSNSRFQICNQMNCRSSKHPSALQCRPHDTPVTVCNVEGGLLLLLVLVDRLILLAGGCRGVAWWWFVVAAGVG